MNDRPIKAILFDFDGVLINSEPLHFYAFETAARSIGIDLTEDEYYDHLVGHDDRGTWRTLFERRNLPLKPATLLALLAHKQRTMRQLILDRPIVALPGVEDLIRGLWRHYPLAICSGAIRDEIEGMIEKVRLRECFRTITSAEDVTRGKPDPEGYLQTMAELAKLTNQKLRPQDCLIVEDAPVVIRAVKPLGFRTLGVASSVKPSWLDDADAVVSNLRPDVVLASVRGIKWFRDG